MLARNCHSKSPKTALCKTDDDITEWDSICPECRQVDWDRLLGLPEEPPDEYGCLRSMTVRAIKTNHEELATSACKLCRILAILKTPDLDTVECIVEAEVKLVHGAMNQSARSGEDREMVTALHIFTEDGPLDNYEPRSKSLIAINRDLTGSSSRAIEPKSINYNRLKYLTKQCVEEHTSHCNRAVPSRLHGLHVIDTSSRTVIEAPVGCQYVALSYVWGQQDAQSPEMDLQRPPPLIEDAISVTGYMGYQYLWIDRYVSHDYISLV